VHVIPCHAMPCTMQITVTPGRTIQREKEREREREREREGEVTSESGLTFISKYILTSDLYDTDIFIVNS
jgi:hypothetical protein